MIYRPQQLDLHGARYLIKKRSGSRDGIALVMVLAFIVLLTILIVSFIAFTRLNRSSTASYAKSIQAQEVAQGGLQDILYDFHQEIVAGSTAYSTNSAGASYTNSLATVYVPTTNWTAEPARLGFGPGYANLYSTNVSSTLLPPTLLRISRASQDGNSNDYYPPLSAAYYPGAVPVNRASAASTTNSAVNGRSVSAARWNKIELLSTNSTIPLPFVTNAPDWVYVTRSGSRAISFSAAVLPSSTLTTTNSVTGRYAYAIYDEGALLDINVAGYGYFPPTTALSLTDKATIGAKGSLAYADLTQLPGFGVTLPAQTTVDNLVKWRNASSGLTGSAATARSNYFAAVVNYSKGGFLAFNTTSNGPDSPLLGRQDLINYFANLDPTINTASPGYASALPYLGTFSRSATAPSWSPPSDASTLGGSNGTGNVYAYHTNAETATVNGTHNPNRDIPNVRFTNITGGSATITHYNDDGTTSTYTVQNGDPIVQRRFSLAKLAWLGHNGPDSTKFASSVNSTQQAQAILACFGLAWDSAALRWDYDHTDADPTTKTPNNIQTLDQIGALATPREADFFELLKAGILQGSLGGQPGAVATSSAAVSTGPAGLNFDYYSAETDRHVRQIGANIIDQADSDNYPTAIYQNLDITSVPPYAEADLYNTVFGEENLPMLQRTWLTCYKTDGSATTAGNSDVWFMAEVWNPHISATASTTTYPNTPTHLRLVTFGGCAVSLTESSSVTGGPAPVTHGPTYSNFGIDPLNPKTAGIVSFINPQPSSTTPAVSFFDAPQELTGYGATTQNNYQDTTQTSGPNNYLWYQQPSKLNTTIANSEPALLGVWLGQFPRDPVTYDHHSLSVVPLQSPTEPQVTFVLQYLDGNNSWRPYSVMARVNEIVGISFSSGSPVGYPDGAELFSAAHPDPRTDRFSAFMGNFNFSGQNYNYPWFPNLSILAANKSATLQNGTGRGSLSQLMPATSAGFSYNNPTTRSGITSYLLDDWANNQKSSVAGAQNYYYQDPDGVIRPGDSWRADYQWDQAASQGGDGVMTYESKYVTSNAVQGGRARPVILNRPFLSVGELGMVFRDQPFKTLDFWSSLSADSGLLDLFSTVDEPPVVAGEISPNAPERVLHAMLAGAMKQYNGSTITGSTNVGGFGSSPYMISSSTSNAEAASIEQAISTELSSNGPLLNRADLVRRFSTPVYNALKTYQATVSTTDNPQDNKLYGETYVRALAPVMNTRTWNILIDIIAQSGHITPTAQSLDDFVVEGERRYWLHVAIDRYTGKVLDQQLEPVYE